MLCEHHTVRSAFLPIASSEHRARRRAPAPLPLSGAGCVGERRRPLTRRTPAPRLQPRALGERRAKHASVKDSGKKSGGLPRYGSAVLRPSPRRGLRPQTGPTPTERLSRAFDVLLLLVGAVTLLGLLLGISADSRVRLRPATAAPVAPQVEVAETERDGTLRVKVVSSGSAPLPHAQVRLFWSREHRYFDAGQGTTNDAGQVVLERVPRGTLWVLADADGHARASTQFGRRRRAIRATSHWCSLPRRS